MFDSAQNCHKIGSERKNGVFIVIHHTSSGEQVHVTAINVYKKCPKNYVHVHTLLTIIYISDAFLLKLNQNNARLNQMFIKSSKFIQNYETN